GPPRPSAAMTSPPVAQRTPGKPGDFGFLSGDWAIRHQRLGDDGRWERFDGEASCHGLLAGACSVEELRIPARKFSGMGLRLLDLQQRVWMDHWVSGSHGVLTLPGMSGSFEQGAGIFEADDEEDGKPIQVRGVWDQIGERACRWQQGVSRDGGAHWDVTWSMVWLRRA
ncbi:MAG: hypothetical protein WAQ05_08485, partial [Rubrivivax sp.]